MRTSISVTVNGRSQTVELDQRATLVQMLRETLGLTGTHVGCATGSCGACTVMLNGRTVKSCCVLAADVATPLAMVLTELVQNATEHAFGEGPGHLEVCVDRSPGTLRVRVRDDGRGLPPDFDAGASPSLGLSIVRTLVESELGGTLTLGPAPDRGTQADVLIPLP